jgi:hypothetical protein
MGMTGAERNDPTFLSFFVPSGATKSTALTGPNVLLPRSIENPRMSLAAVVTPAAFDGAGVGFEVSLDGNVWYPVYNPDGTAYALTVAAGRWTCIPPAVSYAWQYIRIVTAAQSADRSVMGVFMIV